MADGIRGRTARACFDTFVDHLNPLVQATLPTKVPLEVVVLEGQQATAALGFRGTHTIPLPTKHGKVYFHLAQSLECIEDKKQPASVRFRLSTRQYWYRLQREDGQADALLRWEYLSPTLPSPTVQESPSTFVDGLIEAPCSESTAS